MKPDAPINTVIKDLARGLRLLKGHNIPLGFNAALLAVKPNKIPLQSKQRAFAILDHSTEKDVLETILKIEPDLSEHLDESKRRILARILLMKLDAICDLPGCGNIIPVEREALPKDYTPFRDFLIQHASEESSLTTQPMIDFKRIIQFSVTFLPDSLTSLKRRFSWTKQDRNLIIIII